MFYHKRTHYTFGPSPLVVWLKAYMLPEILGISVPAELLALAPSTYGGFSAHAETVRQKKIDREQQQQQAADGKMKSDADSVQVCCVADCHGDEMSAGDGVTLIDSSEISTNPAADTLTEAADNMSAEHI